MKLIHKHHYWIYILLAFLWSNSHAVVEGDIVVDPPTLHAFGFYVPYTGNQVQLEYRTQGTLPYKPALDMLAIGPARYAGSILGLQSNTAYDIRIIFDDGTVITKNLTTLSEPRLDPQTRNLVTIPDDKNLVTALNEAKPGDVLFLKNGIYPGPITITKGGTKINPVILRGESLAGVIIDSPPGTIQNGSCGGSSNIRI
ncbi:MAG: hypothetical protein ACC707_16985, partial [Thiohalomonadales bacterium]